MNKNLPTKPNLEHLKAQAKDLLRQLRLSNPNAKLSDAQHALANEYGFTSWPNLKEHVETVAIDAATTAELVTTVEAGIRQGLHGVRARKALIRRPDLVNESLTCALIALDDSAARKLLDPTQVNAKIGAFDVPPIVYAAFSPLASEKPEAYLATMRWLVEAGADVNATYTDKDFPQWPLSVLYSAAGAVRSPAVTELLLKAGANPNDNESLYHSTESRDHSCTKLLLEHGAKFENTNAVLRMLDFEDMEGLNLILSYQPDLNHPNALIHAMRRGRSEAIVARLLEAGADPKSSDDHGTTAARIAFERNIHVGSLTEGFVPTEQDELLAACWRGDVDTAARLKSAHQGLGKVRMKAFTDACWANRADTVDAFLAGGFTLLDRDDSQGTPLHCACYSGSLATVQKLLSHHAPVDDANDMYKATPLMWTMHASAHSLGDGATFPAIAQALIEAGAPKPRVLEGSSEVREVISQAWPDLKEEQ